MVFLSYVLIATIPSNEIFPFFDWDLFSAVHQAERTDYGLRILAVDNHQLEAPLFLEETADIFPLSKSATAYVMVQSVGSALAASEDSDLRKARERLEVNLFESRAVEYELVLRRYDVIERAQTRRFRAVRPLGHFESGE